MRLTVQEDPGRNALAELGDIRRCEGNSGRWTYTGQGGRTTHFRTVKGTAGMYNTEESL